MSRIVVLMPAFNEADIIVHSLQYLIQQGIEVYLLENWSTDATYDLARQFLNQGVVAIERLPRDGPEHYHDWRRTLIRVEQLAGEIQADWFLLQGVDEIHAAPWKNVNLREAIERLDLEGFNCFDHAVMLFHPIDNSFVPGTDFQAHFRHYEWSANPGSFCVRNGWKNTHRPVNLSNSGGHDVLFEGRRAYPFKFLIKHYWVRSQTQGEAKVFRDRKPRWHPDNNAAGWNVHYKHLVPGHQFLRKAAELTAFEELAFPHTLVENGLQLINWGELAAQAVFARQRTEIQTLTGRLAECEGQLPAMQRAEDTAASLTEIRGSRAWRLIEQLRSLRVKLAPPGSRRESAWYSLLRLLDRRT